MVLCSHHCKKGILLTLCSLLLTPVLTVEVLAQSTHRSPIVRTSQTVQFTPDLSRRGRPTRRQSTAGSRGTCATNSEQQLTALIPEHHGLGLTVQSHPTFWVEIPYTADSMASVEFILSDQSNHEVYAKEVPLEQFEPGVISIQLPKDVEPLQLEQEYSWMVILTCQTQHSGQTIAPELYVEGSVTRVALTDSLQQALTRSVHDIDKVAAYAKHGIWFDALTDLGTLYRKAPQDSNYSSSWTDLLEDIRLEMITPPSTTQCCRRSQ